MPKKLYKDGMTVMGTGIVLGIGSQAVNEAGGNAAGLTSMSGKLPMIGGLAATGAVFRGLGTLQKTVKKTRRR